MFAKLASGFGRKARDNISQQFQSIINLKGSTIINNPTSEEPRLRDLSLTNQSNYRGKSQSHHQVSKTISLLPIICVISQKFNDFKCWFGTPEFERNKIKNRIVRLQYPANSPIEDRYAFTQLESLNGYFVSVFDGHGGWQTAEFAKNHLAADLEAILEKNLNQGEDQQEQIIRCLEQAFDSVENKFLEMATAAYKMGFSGTGRVGSCVLSALVVDNKLYAANSGDCKGVICSQEDNQIVCKKINSKQNASSKKEQARLKAQFSTEKDIIVCRKGDSKACYVKNMLQPTRSLGDFRLKYALFNNPQGYTIEQGFPHPLPTFTGPYITHKPEVKVFDLNKKDRYLIMASDGLWDELSQQDIATIVQKNYGDKLRITQALFDSALNKAAKDCNMTVRELKGLAQGSRRRYHDDITILVVDLQNQTM